MRVLIKKKIREIYDDVTRIKKKPMPEKHL
jgi:hypothetical protein